MHIEMCTCHTFRVQIFHKLKICKTSIQGQAAEYFSPKTLTVLLQLKNPTQELLFSCPITPLVNFAYFDTLYKWKHRYLYLYLFVCLFLASSTQSYVCDIHPRVVYLCSVVVLLPCSILFCKHPIFSLLYC